MSTKDNSTLYKIGQVARASNLSRATIMRFEEDGLLKPAYINSESGYRYYSCENLARIFSILKLQRIGFTKKQIREINDSSKIEETINRLHYQHMLILRELEDLTASKDEPETLQVRLATSLGGTFFFRKEKIIYSPENVRKLALDALEDFMDLNIAGHVIQTMKIFIENADPEGLNGNGVSIGQFDGKEHLCTAIIPTLEPQYGENFVTIEPCPTLTMVCKCNYNNSEEMFWRVWHEAKRQGLTPAGPVCIAGLPEIFFSSDKYMSDSTLRLMLRTKGDQK